MSACGRRATIVPGPELLYAEYIVCWVQTIYVRTRVLIAPRPLHVHYTCTRVAIGTTPNYGTTHAKLRVHIVEISLYVID